MLAQKERNLVLANDIIAYVFILSIAFFCNKFINYFIVFFCLLLITSAIVNKNFVINLRITLIVLLFYSFWFIIGLKHKDWHRDVKFHLIWGISILIYYNILEKLNIDKLFKALFTLNVLITIIYFLLKINKFPQIYLGERVLSEGNIYRISGPIVITFYAILFLVNKVEFVYDKFNIYAVFINMIIGIFSILLIGSLQNLVIYISFYYIFFMQKGLMRNLLYIAIILSFFFIIISIFASHEYLEKIYQLKNPLESETIKTRFMDLVYVFTQIKYSFFDLWFGVGVGVKAEIQRIATWNAKTLVDFDALEIDNGFYYIFHRTGIIGLSIFVFINLLTIIRFRNQKNKYCLLIFFVITNLLSVHYVTIFVTSLLFYLYVRHEKTDDEIYNSA